MTKYGAYAARVHEGAIPARGMTMWEKSLQFMTLQGEHQASAHAIEGVVPRTRDCRITYRALDLVPAHMQPPLRLGRVVDQDSGFQDARVPLVEPADAGQRDRVVGGLWEDDAEVNARGKSVYAFDLPICQRCRYHDEGKHSR